MINNQSYFVIQIERRPAAADGANVNLKMNLLT